MFDKKFSELSSLPAIKEASEIAKLLPKVANSWTDDVDFLCQDLQNEIAELLHEVGQGQSNKRRIFEELGDVIFVLCRIANLFDMDVETATNDVICDTDRIVFSVTDQGAGTVSFKLTVAGKSGDEMEARIYTDTGTEFNENIGVTAEAEWDDNVLTATVTNYLSVDKKGELVVVITEKDDPGSLIGFERIPIEIG